MREQEMKGESEGATEVFFDASRVIFVSGPRYARFRITLSWFEGLCVSFSFDGSMRRSTGEEIWIENFQRKIEKPDLIRFISRYEDEEGEQDDYYRPFSSISVDPSFEGEVYGPSFSFDCVGERGYFSERRPEIRDYEHALEIFERSFLVKFMNVFL